MKFNANEWRKIYDKVQFLGQILKDSYEHIDEHENWITPLHPISKLASKSIKKEIKDLLVKNETYLVACKMKPKRPLWKFDPEDSSTCPSSPNFKYKHLLKSQKFMWKNEKEHPVFSMGNPKSYTRDFEKKYVLEEHLICM